MTAPIAKIRRERGSSVYNTLRHMAIAYQFKPGERLSEIELAERLGVSRTPVREALGRLVTEGFLQPATRGYMRRPLDVQETLDLYEARVAIERECMRLAIERATDAEVEEARAYLEESRRVPAAAAVQRLVELDEGFHMRIADMAGNSELRRMLLSLNERIRFIRWIDMENVGRDSTQHEHQDILQALRARDPALSERLLSAHIALRRDQIVDAITRGLARIYLPQEQAQPPGAMPPAA
ncbi:MULTISPECIES: GntR family transcriptional regulator [unclassified Acidovorax]|uniref:GntR family transcriptional regulator n=1 Tax=unclassified Acidovorax TaxID=2684926 RepID=UPI001C4860BC|nr:MULTISPECIES: GntR family transcriptional regulator [unclassified Acidovorax]MBV7430297.1 GntR family transcriptional regulator [Acidovorax sp. sif0732]MBV7451690.1 GntR family transcriptional regulator [Acidovorax sp. sif0715]